MSESTRVVPLTCHGHSRPITHLTFSHLVPSSSNPTEALVSPTTTSAPSPQQQPSYFLLSACKDQNPMLRDGLTGDWIGTFLGHKGAVWAARLSADASLAVTGSADFTARVWDTFTGECVAKIPEAHIVRAVALSPDNTRVATGGMEKKVKIWELGQTGGEKEVKEFVEVGKGFHGATVKSLVWTEMGLVSACDDKTIRWWDVRSPEKPVAEYVVDGLIGSCELNADVGGNGGPGVLSVAAGKNVYIFDAGTPGKLIKRVRMPSETASVAVNQASGRFVTGSSADTWVRVWDLETEEELETGKGHHGPVWTVSFSPDGKLYATGSEDGTIKLWKATREPYGLWR